MGWEIGRSIVLFAFALGELGEKPVSYTHLDVYKRQAWYQDAYKLVKSAGGEPNENKGSWMSRAFKGLG